MIQCIVMEGVPFRDLDVTVYLCGAGVREGLVAGREDERSLITL